MKEINFRVVLFKNNTKLKINLRFSEKLKKGQVLVKLNTLVFVVSKLMRLKGLEVKMNFYRIY